MDHQTKTIKELQAYIETHLEEPLTLDQLSNMVGYSKFHLSRMFMDSVGCTLHKYIQQKRLEKAAWQLRYSEYSIGEIAFDAGYHSQQAFTLAFRQIFQISPHAYRKAQRQRTSQIHFLWRCAA